MERSFSSLRRQCRWPAVLLGSLTVGATLIAGTATSGASQAPQLVRSSEATAPYKIVLSNNFLGNDWRPEMERVATLTSNLPPFKGKIQLSIQNAGSTTSDQIASLNDIIESKPAAILVDASSAAALNPTLTRACNAGILVVSFDNPVTDPCAYKVSQNMAEGMLVVGQWMNYALKGTGSIFVDRGLPGSSLASVIENSFLQGLKIGGTKIKVANYYTGQFAEGPELQGISADLVGDKSVTGVMTQGYCKPAFTAFKSAGITGIPAASCFGYNGELLACAQDHAKCAVLTGSPVVVQIALKLTLDVLDGTSKPSKAATVPVPMLLYTSGTPGFRPMQNPANLGIDPIVVGKNAYPQLAPGLALPFTLPQYNITAAQAG
jgi:ribose transport system substrate-binding protein